MSHSAGGREEDIIIATRKPVAHFDRHVMEPAWLLLRALAFLCALVFPMSLPWLTA